MKTFLNLLRPHLWPIVGALLAVGVAAGMVLTFGWGLKALVDEGFSDRSGHYLNMALLTLLAVILLMAAASYARFYLASAVAERMTSSLRRTVYGHLLTLDPSYFETHKSGDLVSRLSADTAVLQTVLSSNLPIAFRHGLTLIGGLVMLFLVSPVLTLMVLAVIPLVVAPILYFARRVKKESRAAQSRVGDIGAFSSETIQGLQTVQAFGYEASARAIFGRLSDESFSAALRYVKLRSFLTAFVIATVFGAVGVVLWAGGHKVLSGTMSAGDLSAFVFYAVVTAGAAGSLGETASSFAQGLGALERISSLLAQESKLKGDAEMVETDGSVTFENVTFAYPTRPDHPSLNGVSFHVKPGTAAALIGASGAGKSTVFQLLQRFYDPQGGRVLIGGKDIAAFKPASVRHHLGVVAQDPAIFSVTIAENIRLGKPNATDAEVIAAAEAAQAHEFISKLPQGYDTLAGERGNRLSGGQKQRIAIARMILKNPKIVLLDEATSALDTANESAVMQALKNLMKGRTSLVIAHRLSTVQNAEKIIVLEQGRVAAEGGQELSGYQAAVVR